MKTFEPGIHNISNEDYHASAGISRSGIMQLKRSPLHYWHNYLNPLKDPEKQTPALIFGNAVHAAILEPDTFLNNFCIMPKVDRRTTEGKNIYASFCAANVGKTIISEEDYAVIKKIYEAINSTNIPQQLIEGAQYEKSIYWVDSETGVLCKARPDILHSNMIVDLKTTANASYSSFQHDLAGYGYHIQAAMLNEASRAILKKDIRDFIFLAIEKEPPYAIGVYQLDDEALEKGREIFKGYLKIYKECLEKNDWPSYPIERISLPRYAA